MNLNNLTIEEKAEMELFIARSFECSLEKKDFEVAKIHLEFYKEHIKEYGSANIQRYCNLYNRYSRLIGNTKLFKY